MAVGSLRVARLLSVFRLRRLLLVVTLGVVSFLGFRFHDRARVVFPNCSGTKSWPCRWDPIKYNDDAQPLVNQPIIQGFSASLDDIYGTVSDTIYKSGGLLEWDYTRDANDTSMSRRQCLAAFPAFYSEIARSQSQYTVSHVTEKDLDQIEMSEGRVRAGIISGKLFIFKANLSAESRHPALAVLQSLNSAVSNPGPNFIRDIEFILSVRQQVPDIASPLWVFDRRPEDEKAWLMPDPGFVFEEGSLVPRPPRSSGSSRESNISKSTPSPPTNTSQSTITYGKYQAGSSGSAVFALTREQLVAEIESLETSVLFQEKSKRLAGVWTVDHVPQTVRQKDLARVATGQPWVGNDKGIRRIEAIDGSNGSVAEESANPKALKLSQMCRFSFLAYDTSFNIPLTDGPLLCTSVLLTTKPKWIQLYHNLMLADRHHFQQGDGEHPVVRGWAGNGPGAQNVVLVGDDWGDLSYKMAGLLRYPEAAAAIAINNVNTFRRRYLTRAATACYWREMFRAYSSVSFKPTRGTNKMRRGLLGDHSKRRKTQGGIQWDAFLLLDEASQAHFDEEEV